MKDNMSLTNKRMVVSPSKDGDGRYDLKVDDYYVALTIGGHGALDELAHAKRIAACWNACLGLSDFALNAGVKPLNDLTRQIEAAIFTLQQIDPLVRPAKVNEALAMLRETGQ